MENSFYLHKRNPDWKSPAKNPAIEAFHRSLDGYQQTELREISNAEIPARIFVKIENKRFTLPAFKGLGASWAIHNALQKRGADEPRMITTASDGNHGRAVAHFAKELGCEATIFIPKGVSQTAIDAIASEGARVEVLDCSYDDAVATARDTAAKNNWLLVQDTSWPGYEEIPQTIVDGYSTMFVEIDEQLRDAGIDQPDVVLVPTGVGSLLQAALERYRRDGGNTKVVAVEADAAACMQVSLEAGEPVTVETGVTVMAGLNCGTPSTLAWPAISNGLDAVIHIQDSESIESVKKLSRDGVDAGPCGASTLAATKIIFSNESLRRHLGLDNSTVILLLSTEGLAANPIPLGL